MNFIYFLDVVGIDNFIYSLATNISSTVIGFFIIYQILKKIENKSKLFAAIYFYMLFTLISFMFIFYVKYKKGIILSDFFELFKQILYTVFEGMILSLIICIFFSFMIFILYLFEGSKNGR